MGIETFNNEANSETNIETAPVEIPSNEKDSSISDGSLKKEENAPESDYTQKTEVLYKFFGLQNSWVELLKGVGSDATMGDALKSLANKPSQIIETRKILKNLVEISPEIDRALNDSYLRHDALSLLVTLQERVERGRPNSYENRALRKGLFGLISQKLESIAPRFKEDDGEDVANSITLVTELYQAGMREYYSGKKTNWHNTARTQMEDDLKDLPQFIEEVQNTNSYKRDVLNNVDKYTEIILTTYGSEEGRSTAEKVFETLFLNKKTWKNESCMGKSIDAVVDREGGKSEFFQKILLRLGLNPDSFYTATKESCRENEFLKYLEKNTRAAISLELERQGAVSALSKDFGIQAFSRYPKEMLIKQFDNLENADDPYGVIVYPRSDHNGAFYRERNKLVFSDFLSDNETAGFQVRVFEAQSRIDTAKRLLTADKKYGGKQKISYAIIGGHGNEEVLVQGRDDKLGNISEFDKRSLSGKGTRKAVKSIFINRPTFIFDSCSVGANNGVAEFFADEHDAEVYASDSTMMGIKLLQCHKNSQTNKLEFNVEMDTEGGRTKHILGDESRSKKRREDEAKELEELFKDLL